MEQIIPGQVPTLAASRGFFSRFRLGAFADSEAGEQRRSDVAIFLNALYKICTSKDENDEALLTVKKNPKQKQISHLLM